MRKISIFIALLTASAFAQVPQPQINLTGNVGAQGFPVLNSGVVQFTSDANHTLTALETSATGGIKVTSTVPLTATRNLILPSGNFQFIAVENATTGGQSIQVIGQSGTGVTIANGASATVWFDGTNVVQTGSSSSSGPTLQTNGASNASQSSLNLVSGTNVTVTNTSGGNVAISSAGSSGSLGTVQVAGSSAGTFAASTPAYVATSLLSPALNNFRTALYSSSTGGTPATSTNVLVVGTSITCCIGPALAADSPMAQLKSTLKQFGSNGTGVVTVGANGSTFTRPEWTLAGTWTTVADLGPTQTNSGAAFNSMFVASGNGSGNTLTMANQSGDTLLLYAETTTDSGGCAVSVDGGAPGVFANTTSGSPTMTLTTYVPGPGSHTIVVQPSGSGKCYFYAAQWETANVSGVILNNIAHGYATTNAFCQVPSAQMAVVPLISPAPSLAIVELGINEIIEGTITQSTYATQMQACVTYLRGINPNMSILFLDDYNINPANIGTGMTYAQARATEQTLATSNNAAYMSIGDSWGTFAQANALGLMNGDGTHPSNLGGINYGALVASYITMGINNLPLTTIRPFIVQQPYPATAGDYPLFLANPQAPSTSKLNGGFNLYAAGASSGYLVGMDVGINQVIGGYGPRIYNNDGNTGISSDVIFAHYPHASGYPTQQSSFTQDGYIASSDQSLHMVGSITGSTINGLTGFQLNSAAPSGHCLLGNGTKYVDSASCGGGVVTSLTTTGSSGAATLTSGVLNIPTPTNASALTSGTLADALLSSNVPLLNASNVFTGTTNTFGTFSVGTVGLGSTGFSAQAGQVATSSTNYNSPLYGNTGNYWNGTASAQDSWFTTFVLGSGANPTSTLTFTHSGSSGAASVSLPALKTSAYTVGTLPSASSLPAGTQVTVSDDSGLPTSNTCTGSGTEYAIAITNGTTWTCH